jgi:hypothetical protein
MLRTANAEFKVGDDMELGDTLDVIIIAAVNENRNYGDARYDPNNISPPECFAVGKIGQGKDLLAPPQELLGDAAQSDLCGNCKWNAFGSALQGGRGKQCKNNVRLALLPSDDMTEEGLRKADGVRLRISTTSLRTWSKYVKELRTVYGYAPNEVVTRISVLPDEVNQQEYTFEALGGVDPAFESVIEERREECREPLESYPSLDDGGKEREPEPRTRRNLGTGRKKKAARKKVARRKG